MRSSKSVGTICTQLTVRLLIILERSFDGL